MDSIRAFSCSLPLCGICPLWSMPKVISNRTSVKTQKVAKTERKVNIQCQTCKANSTPDVYHIKAKCSLSKRAYLHLNYHLLVVSDVFK